ncbi:MAG: arginine--tRNA ligase [Planctomycetota bacterium]
MNALAEFKHRFADELARLVDDPSNVLEMIRPAGDPKFGDYQANCAMPLSKVLGKPSREIAADLIESIRLDDLCANVEVAGPGFINLTLKDDWIKERLTASLADERLGVPKVAEPKTYVVDFSSPNVAKPMHVGHIRSTVIGDAISKVLRFAGHNVLTDNHLGDWGTQFGMIIYGYKNFLDEPAFDASPVRELGRLYKLVRSFIDYQEAQLKLPGQKESLAKLQAEIATKNEQSPEGDKKAIKKHKKALNALHEKSKQLTEAIESAQKKITAIDVEPKLKELATKHPDIGNTVLLETAALHSGDQTNVELWEKFLPRCREDIQRIYQRLDIKFDHELGESFYHPMLAEVVHDLEAKGYTKESDGAICVFLDDHDAPMIVRKKDGAFLYATTDLATIKHRVDQWQADASLYVVDHRQSEHFEKLFDVARLWGFGKIELTHVSFGTVLDKDGRPYKTREGTAEGLEGLLDEAEHRALEIVRSNSTGLDEEQLKTIATVVGIGGVKYADLSHNRTSDYRFDYDKMLATRGNSSTYLQYAYARVQGIVRKTEADVESLRKAPEPFEFQQPVERQLAVKLLQFSEAIDSVLVEYKPNLLCSYLFELAQLFAQFFDQCSVKDAESESLKKSRLQLCDLAARTIKTGLELLGIRVLEKM